ncbi:WD40 repeat-like protein [Paxillus ammoniavirescens]|nr:WD40 repeat-like protein [Paxillus ammoniavirescens]
MIPIGDVVRGQRGAERDPDHGDREDVDEWEEPVRPLQPRHILEGHTNDIRTLASIPDSNLFVSGSDDGSCMVWNAKDGGEVGKKMVHGGNVYAIVVSRDGKTMASGGNDGRIAVWNLESREKIMAWKAESTLQVWSLAMSQDSHTLASGHNDGTVMLWNTSTGKLIAEPYKLHDRDVDALAFSADDSQIASSSFYSDYTQVTPGHFKEDVIPSFKADDDGVRSLVWLSNGQLISASWDKTIKFWDTSHGSLLMATSRGHTLSVEGLAVTSDGKLLASCSLDQTARLWSVSTHEQIGPALQHPTSLCSVALSSDGHYLAAGGKNNKVYIWNLKDIKELAEIIAAPEKPGDNDTARDDASNGSSCSPQPVTQTSQRTFPKCRTTLRRAHSSLIRRSFSLEETKEKQRRKARHQRTNWSVAEYSTASKRRYSNHPEPSGNLPDPPPITRKSLSPHLGNLFRH